MTISHRTIQKYSFTNRIIVGRKNVRGRLSGRLVELSVVVWLPVWWHLPFKFAEKRDLSGRLEIRIHNLFCKTFLFNALLCEQIKVKMLESLKFKQEDYGKRLQTLPDSAEKRRVQRKRKSSKTEPKWKIRTMLDLRLDSRLDWRLLSSKLILNDSRWTCPLLITKWCAPLNFCSREFGRVLKFWRFSESNLRPE